MLINGVELSIEPQANLSGANLRRADLTESDLSGANLSGANLTEADFRGAVGVIGTGTRVDGCRFILWVKDRQLRVATGFRDFALDEARAHWTKTRGGTPLGDEALAILDHGERVAKIRGMLDEHD